MITNDKTHQDKLSQTSLLKKKVRLLWLVVLCMILLGGRANAQVTVSGSTSANATYTTLKLAFDAINGTTQTNNNVIITITASTTETASAVLNEGAWTTLVIYPTVGGLSISGNIGNSPLIDLNGADNVTIDGQVNATGGSISLVIINTSASGYSTSAIRFINNATNNTIKYSKIQGSNTASNGAILIFSTTASGSSGNNSNIIDHNEITCAGTNRPLNVIYSIGSSTAPNILNTISYNNIYNFLNPNNSSCGIILAEAVDTKGYNSDWSITGNSFYETTTFQPSGGSYNIIYINTQNNGTSYGDNFTISYNSIGGSGPGCTGMFNKTTGTNYFWGIQLHVGTARASNIQGNTISNINYSNDGGPDWWGIYIDWGAVNIGTTAPNYIGAGSDGGSITYTCAGNNARFLAIHLQGDGICYVQKNVISSITVTNTNSAYATSFWGIHQQARTNTNVISNNTIGSATTANSIRALSASTGNDYPQMVIGYSGDGNGGTMTVSNNTIANLTNGTSNTTVGTKGKVYGIWAFAGGTYTISENTIHDLTIANANTQTGPTPSDQNISLSAGGILFSGSSNVSHTISGNTVYNISNTYSSFAGTVAGVYFYGQTTLSSVDKNLIYGLSSSSSSANIHGIKIGGGVTTYSNNIINLDGTASIGLNGIYEPGTSGTTSNIYFNTVYLGGSLITGSLNSACLYNAGNSSTRNFRNNIFVNARSNSGSSGTHYAMSILNTGGTLTCDYNDYFVSGTGGKLGYFGSEKTGLPIVTGATGNDAQSKNVDPLFAVSPPGTTAANYLPSFTSLIAATGTGITTDYDGGASRSGTLPAMGAFEYTVSTCVNPTSGGTIAADQTICSGIVPASFTSSAAASGHSGTLEYKWQLSTTSNSDGFSDIASGNAATWSPGALTATTWYKRLARVNCMSDWTSVATSNVVQITVKPIPADQTVSPASQSICSGTSATISIGSSQTNTNYYLRNNSDDTVIDGPKAGNGSSVDFNTGVLTTDKTYHILAEKADVNSTALSMDDVNEYVSTANVSMGSTWTYETLIKPNDPSPNWSGIITSNSGSGSGMWFQFGLNGNGKLLWESSDPGIFIDGIGPVINDNTWHHVAVTCDGTNIRFYTDGVLENTTGFGGGTMNRPLHIMAERQPEQFIPGLVDQTMVWNYARSLAEIQSDKTTLLTGTESGLLVYYTYENGTGSTVTDIAGGNHNGTLMNMENGDWIADGDPFFTNNTCPTQLSSTATVSIGGSNPTSGGTIATAQTICSGFAPAAFTSTVLPTGYSGTLEYKWQKSTSSGSAGFADIASSNSATFAPGALTTSTWYKRLAKVTCDATWPAAGESNVVQITVDPSIFVPAVRHVSDLTATGQNIKWYAAASGGTALASTDVLPTGTTHYYASQTVNSVESTARLDVTVTVDPTPCAPGGVATQSFADGSTIGSLAATGSNIRWYSASSGGLALSTNTLLVNGTHYYASQTVDCTESVLRLDVVVLINE